MAFRALRFAVAQARPRQALGNIRHNWTVSQLQLSSRAASSSPVATSKRGRTVWPVLLGVSAVGFTGLAFMYLGQPDAIDNEPGLQAMLDRAQRRSKQLYQDYMHPPREILLPTLPPHQRLSEYTLVVDLEDTLIHSEWTMEHGWRVRKRPGAERFLEICCLQLGLEIVIFSEKHVMDAFPLVDKLDSKGYAMWRLYKDHMWYENGRPIKDLELLGRDLSKVIVVDDNRDSVAKHKNNVIQIPAFEGDKNDRWLMELIPLLTHVVTSGNDVRDVVSSYEEDENIIATFQTRLQEIASQQAALAAEQQQQHTKRRRFGGLFG